VQNITRHSNRNLANPQGQNIDDAIIVSRRHITNVTTPPNTEIDEKAMSSANKTILNLLENHPKAKALLVINQRLEADISSHFEPLITLVSGNFKSSDSFLHEYENIKVMNEGAHAIYYGFHAARAIGPLARASLYLPFVSIGGMLYLSRLESDKLKNHKIHAIAKLGANTRGLLYKYICLHIINNLANEITENLGADITDDKLDAHCENWTKKLSKNIFEAFILLNTSGQKRQSALGLAQEWHALTLTPHLNEAQVVQLIKFGRQWRLTIMPNKICNATDYNHTLEVYKIIENITKTGDHYYINHTPPKTTDSFHSAIINTFIKPCSIIAKKHKFWSVITPLGLYYSNSNINDLRYFFGKINHAISYATEHLTNSSRQNISETQIDRLNEQILFVNHLIFGLIKDAGKKMGWCTEIEKLVRSYRGRYSAFSIIYDEGGADFSVDSPVISNQVSSIRLQEQLTATLQRAEAAEAREAVLRQERNTAREELGTTQQERNTAREELGTTQQERNTAREEAKQAQDELTTSKNTIQTQKKQLKKLEQQVKGLAQRVENAQGQTQIATRNNGP